MRASTRRGRAVSHSLVSHAVLETLERRQMFTVLPSIPATTTAFTRPADGADGGQTEGMGLASTGVRYMDGAVSWTANDFEGSGLGTSFLQSRTWSSLTGFYSTNISHNGDNWFNSYLPYLGQETSSSDAVIAVVTNGTAAEYFDVDPGDASKYAGRNFNLNLLQHNTTNHTFTLTDTSGHQVIFDDFHSSIPVRQRGQFKTFIDEYGKETSVSSLDTDGRILQIEKSSGSGSTLLKETFDFVYSGDLVTSVTMNHTRGTGSAQQVRKVEYTYYDGTTETSNGTANDLRTVTLKDTGTGVISRSYYRYYTSGVNAGKLKYVVEGPSYARADAASGSWDPTTASDAQLDDYADAYFEYDATSGQVTKARLSGTGSSSATYAGRGDYTYSYSTPVSGASGYNTWKYKTTEERRDSSNTVIDTNVVYSNEFGQVILTKFTAGSSSWLTYNNYSSQGRLLKVATPSAMTTSGSGATSVLTDSTTTFYAKNDQGLVYQYGFDSSTDESFGRFLGFSSGTYLLHGYTDASGGVLVSDATYVKHTANDINVYNVATSLSFPDGSAHTTSYTYDFYSGTNGIKSISIQYPSAGTHASGTGDTESKFYDTFGKLIWRKDGDGYLHYTEYDDLTGAATKRIKDVNTDSSYTSDFQNLPSGWSNTSGLRLITQYTVDELGRSTKITDPLSNSTYIVYKDTDHEYRVYTAWSTSSHTSVGPTFMRREDWDRGYVEKLTMSPTLSSTNWNGSGEPLGNETPSTLQTLYREYENTGGQVTKVDRYFTFTGGSFSYSTASDLGTLDTNYYRTTLGYDTLGRNNKITRPTGTIQKYTIDSLGRVTTEAIGTDDGSPGNMVTVGAYEYDDADPYDSLSGGVGDGNLTRITRSVDSSSANDRISILIYDWRNRAVLRKDGARTALSSETDDDTHPITYMEYDNEDRVTLLERFDGEYTSSSTLQHTSFQQDSSDEVPNRPTDPGVDSLTGHILLTSRKTFSYDTFGRMVENTTFSVDPTSGDYSDDKKLTTGYWYDRRGNVIRISSPGGLVTEKVFDGAGRLSTVYFSDGAGGATWDDAITPTSDHVLEQVEFAYDKNSNLILATRRQRFHNDTVSGDAGALGTISSTYNKARVGYTSYYYDTANRATKKVVVGTNGTGSYTRPTSETDSDNDRSATRLVTTYGYNSAGWLETVTNPRNVAGKTYYDTAGRVTKTIANYVDGTPSNADDQTVEYTYDGSDHVLTYKAVLPSSVYQETKYIYGESSSNIATSNGITWASGSATVTTTSAHNFKVGENITIRDSSVSGYNGTWSISVVPNTTSFKFSIASNLGTATGGTARRDTAIFSKDILTATQYSNKTSNGASTSEQEFYTLNAQSERTALTDRNGNVHVYARDGLGRLVYDKVSTLGNGVDGFVRRLEYTYNQEGLNDLFTSYSTATGTSARNQVKRTYNGFGQVAIEYQNHSTVVNTSTTPKVQYLYGRSEDETNANTSRLRSIIYPDGRQVNYRYFGGGIDDAISRVSFIQDNDGVTGRGNGPLNGPNNYTAPVGDNDFNTGTHLEEYNYLGLSTVVERNRPQSGTKLTYIKQGSESDGEAGDQYKGLDRFGRIIDQRWRNSGGDSDRFKYTYDENSNVTIRENTIDTGKSETYAYDNLDRLTTWKRGTLVSGVIASSPTPIVKTWSLDAAGNPSYANRQNQIGTDPYAVTSVTYDKNGNMTTTPDGVSGMTYDAWNRLVVWDEGGMAQAEPNPLIRRYRYDALDRKNWEHTEIDPNGEETFSTITITRDVYWSIWWQALQETGDGHDQQNVFSPLYVDGPILTDRDANDTAGDGPIIYGTTHSSMEERSYAQADANWNTTSITDSSGSVTERYYFDAYGSVTIYNPAGTSTRSSSSYDFKYMFQGARFDARTGLYDLRHRDYLPGIERFLQQDPNPAGQYNDGANLYEFVESNPISSTDPLGLQSGPATRPSNGEPPSQSNGRLPNEPSNPGGFPDDMVPGMKDLPSFKDKDGKTVPVIKIPSNAKTLELAIRRIAMTQRGKEILDKLAKNKRQITINIDDTTNGTRQNGDDIWINFKKIGYMGNDKKGHEFTVERELVHELGHADGAPDERDDQIDNINNNENPGMREFPGAIDRMERAGYIWNGIRWIKDPHPF